ncbi:uncharacterized protein EI97DRAFT_165947 [Westerdykella ornata]|uniref:Uncharacterized protein n=1 Tax=Westerdykella ornata TaxID=318751 RepID=A0A6A6JA30_WESOR|nr:uncharacterized protein EI97DRAFT_165947 [Westerdykella ornata]KAF2273252.1 hypothetical protein EI97DRAFT_165947 [Westerdykella ornata]
MAEIGLIASVIQVAGAGLKLSQTLYQYAESVSSADRRVKDIAKEVQLTSFVINELASIFKNDESSSLLSENAIKTADETVRECSSVFTELDAALKKTKKSALGKFKFPFRETKIELLRNQIDKLKSTLQLLLQVLTLAHQKASQKLDREAEAAHRAQIKALLENKKASTKRYEESLRNLKFSDDEESDKENEEPGSATDSMTIASVKSGITVDALATCVQHVRGLLQDIESLQKVLSDDAEGKDPSEHHQSLIGSYFRARGHLDSILLGNPNDNGSSMTSSVNRSEVDIGITKSLSGITLQGVESHASTEVVVQSARESTSSLRPMLTEAEFQKAILEAQEKARREERERLQLEARKRAEESMLQEQAKAKQAELLAMKETVERKKKAMDLARKALEDEMEKARRRAERDLEITKQAAQEAEARRAKEAGETADTAKQPLKLTDAIGRKSSLPFHLCKTWQLSSQSTP